jgi:hypothetical protein
MSPKKRILRELALAHEPESRFCHVRPSDIPGYTRAPERYQDAVNALLEDRLIEGRMDADGRMSIGLNEHRLAEVRRALRPLWARPGLWAAVAIAALLGVGLAL